MTAYEERNRQVGRRPPGKPPVAKAVFERVACKVNARCPIFSHEGLRDGAGTEPGDPGACTTRPAWNPALPQDHYSLQSASPHPPASGEYLSKTLLYKGLADAFWFFIYGVLLENNGL